MECQGQLGEAFSMFLVVEENGGKPPHYFSHLLPFSLIPNYQETATGYTGKKRMWKNIKCKSVKILEVSHFL